MDKLKLHWCIQQLEDAWDENGFLHAIRNGIYSQADSNEFLSFLQSIDISNMDYIPRRLVSLLWYLPQFLEWQKERILDKGGDIVKYEQFVNQVNNTMEKMLGVP